MAVNNFSLDIHKLFHLAADLDSVIVVCLELKLSSSLTTDFLNARMAVNTLISDLRNPNSEVNIAQVDHNFMSNFKK